MKINSRINLTSRVREILYFLVFKKHHVIHKDTTKKAKRGEKIKAQP
jgi:hypothetical protein